MGKRKKTFKQESKAKSGWFGGDKTLELMDDYFKEQSEKYRRMRKK